MPSHLPHQPDQPILDLHHVTVRYDGHVALDNITFHLHPGEHVAVVGPNGAGKSTLLKLVAGVLRPTEGEVTISGTGPGGHICIGYIPQRSQVDWHFPVNLADVVMMGRVARMGWLGWPRRRDWDFVDTAIETVGMTDLRNRQIGELSGGQQQRMFIARALAQEAELMLMDEPLTGLDTPAQEGLLELIAGLQKKKVTMLVSTHDLEQAAKYFDRLLLLNHKMVAFGPPDQVLKPENLLVAYGGRYRTTEGKPTLSTLDDGCCDDEVEHDHAP